MNNQSKKYLFLSLFLFAVSAGLAVLVFPNFQSARLLVEGKEPVEISWPFIKDAKEEETTFTLLVRVNLPSFHPSLFSIVGDDRIDAISVNGQPVETVQYPIPYRPADPIPLPLEKYLKAGSNEILLTMHSENGPFGFRIFTHPLDPLHMLWCAVLIAAFACAFLSLAEAFPESFGGIAPVILIGGVALRVIYLAATPYFLRAYDMAGHVEFIKYIVGNLSLPPATHGWETHQPPLYYIILGTWTILTGQTSCSWLYGQWQFFALLLSVACLLLATLIGRLLFGATKNSESAFGWYLGIIAVFPGLVYYAARINNDVLFAFISFLWLYLLLRWWNNPTTRLWWGIAIVLGLGCLVKNSTLVLICITAGCLLLVQRDPKQIIRHGAALALAIVLISGWHQIPRALQATDSSNFVVGNVHLLGDDIRINATLPNMVVFNPAAVIEYPYAHPYSDEFRRHYYLEYYIKSAFFGEWTSGVHLLPAARALMTSTLVALVLALGVIFHVRRGLFVPLLLAGAGVFAAQFLYTMKEPFACSQDFRYFIVIVLPFAALLGLATTKLGTFAKVGTGLFILSSVSLLTILYVV